MSRDHFWLTDKQFARIAPHLPTGTRGKPRVDDRRVVSGLVQVRAPAPSQATTASTGYRVVMRAGRMAEIGQGRAQRIQPPRRHVPEALPKLATLSAPEGRRADRS